MEIQLALAGNSADTAKYRTALVARGFAVKIQDVRKVQDGELKSFPGDPVPSQIVCRGM